MWLMAIVLARRENISVFGGQNNGPAKMTMSSSPDHMNMLSGQGELRKQVEMMMIS